MQVVTCPFLPRPFQNRSCKSGAKCILATCPVEGAAQSQEALAEALSIRWA